MQTIIPHYEMENYDIAIIGFSFKLPQEAEDGHSLWDVLLNKRNFMTTWPESRNLAPIFGVDHHVDPGTASQSWEALFKGGPGCKPHTEPSRIMVTLDTTFDFWYSHSSYLEVSSKSKGPRTAVFGASVADVYARLAAKDLNMSPQMTTTGAASSILAN
ncbi:hypothetical protein F5Y11DRAFT_362217 [Daldinia sp. FL1419]|nr:hypothetical protein F5Y11DRAFT_362217 [Daldinia sp. FL1419]